MNFTNAGLPAENRVGTSGNADGGNTLKLLVTGGCGFIGGALSKGLAARGDTVLSVDVGVPAESMKHQDLLGDRLQYVTADLTEWAQIAQLVKSFRPDAILHCAAIVGVVNSVSAPVNTMRVNVEGSLNLFEAMRLFGVPRLVHVSSEEVYGSFDSDTITEDHPARPVKPYGISKYAVEQLARDYVQTYGLDILHVRTCWVYGPNLPRPRIPKVFVDAIAENRPLHLPNGKEFRVDQVYIDDCLQGILKVLDKPDHRFDVYNIATGAAPSIQEIVEILQDLAPGAELSVGNGDYQFKGGVKPVRKGALNISRAQAELGYKPQYTIKSGLEKYLEWRQAQ